MFIQAMVLGFIVALIRKGKIKNIENIYIKGWYLIVLSGLIQVTISFFKGRDFLLGPIFFDKYFFYVHLLTYILLIVGIVLNIKKRFMLFVLIGFILNFIVIFSNGGKMPVSFKYVKGFEDYEEKLLEQDYDIKHSPVSRDTKFVCLADIISLPSIFPIVRIVSIGDIFLSIGMFLFFQEAMLGDGYKSSYT